MAARINTKFIIILGVALVGIGGLIGALWYLQIKGDATRNVAEGDRYFEAGEYERARAFYGRAVNKEPGRVDYLRKLESAILNMTPTTSDHANELYRERVNILRHEARHFPFDAEAHLRLIEELVIAARTVQQPEYWEQVGAAADDMVNRVPLTDPSHARGQIYRGMAIFSRASLLTPQEIEEGEEDLLVAVESMPNDDMAWAALTSGQLTMAQELQKGGQTRKAEDAFGAAKASLAEGLEAVPNGVEMARVELMFKLFDWNINNNAVRQALVGVDLDASLAIRPDDLREVARTTERLSDTQKERIAETADAQQARIDDLKATADRLLGLLEGDHPVYVVTDAAEVVRQLALLDEGQRIIDLMRAYLDRDPDSYQIRYYLARVLFLMQEVDEAFDHAVVIKDSEPLAVSFSSRLQGEMRRRAAALIADIEQARWERSDPAEQAEMIVRIEAAKDELVKLVSNPETDASVARAEGKLAFAKEDYHTAANRLEYVVTDETYVDAQVLMYLATALRKIGTTGIALERVTEAAEYSPSNVPILLEKARLETELGRFEAAQSTLDRVQALKPDSQPAAALREIIARRERGGGDEGESPIIPAIQTADAAFASGDAAGARAVLTTTLNEHPDDVRLIEAMARLEMSEENKAAARVLLEQALTLQPNNRRLAGMAAAVEIEDPVDAMAEYLEAYFEDDAARAIGAAVNFANLQTSFLRRAERLETEGDTEAAEDARAVARRARERSDQGLVRAQQLSPDNVRLLEFSIYNAVQQANWTLAEELLAKGASMNLDQAGGAFYRGRYEMYREQYAAAIISLTEASSRVPYSNQIWRALAGAYLATGNYPEALRAAEQAYNCNPNEIATLEQYVNLLIRTEQKTRALSILRNARNRFMANQKIREAWLRLEVDAGDGQIALDERRRVRRELPKNATNAVALAALLNGLEPTRALLLDDEGNARYNQRAWDRLGAEGQARIVQQQRVAWYAEADEIIEGLMAENPGNLSVIQVKAALLRDRGAVADGEKLLVDYITSRPTEERTVNMFLLLGAYQAETKNWGNAIATLEAGRAYQSEDKREADLALAQLHSQRSDFKRSLAHYATVNEVAPTRQIKLQMVEMMSRGQMFDEADQLLEQMIAESGPDYLTTMLRASIDEGRGEALFFEGDLEGASERFASQRRLLAEAQSLNPATPTPQILLARSLLREARRTEDVTLLNDALMALESAEETRAGTIEASLVRVDIYETREDRVGAIGELTRLLERAPTHDRARRLLLQKHMERAEYDAALRVAVAGAEANPTMSYWYERVGDLYALGKGDFTRAGEAYKNAYDVAPSVRIVSKLADVWLAAEDPNFDAVVSLIQEQEGRPDPLLAFLYATALDALGRRDEALEQVKLAYSMHEETIARGASRTMSMDAWFRSVKVLFDEPDEAADAEAFVVSVAGGLDDPEVLRGLASVWFLSGQDGWTRALEFQQQAIDLCPDENTELMGVLYLDLGQYQLQSGDFSAATTTFERLVEADPENIMGLNNYAYLLATHHDQPQKGLPYAQQAAKLDSKNGDVLDTLGVIEYQLGEYELARQHLLESNRQRSSSQVLLHLAQTLVKLQQPREALNHLERALELDPDDQTKAEIEALEADIRTGTGLTG